MNELNAQNAAKWIGGGNILKKEFNILSVENTLLIVTGLGYYKVYINGKKVGDIELAPSYTDYKKRVEYNEFDVSNFLVKGKNEIKILLGGHFNKLQLEKSRFLPYYSGKNMAFAYLKTNKSIILKTDSSWKVGTSQIVESSIYDGEIFDSNILDKEYDDCDNAVIMENTAQLVLTTIPPIRVIKTHKPKIIKQTETETVYDFGVNIAGKLHIQGIAEQGERIIMTHSENLFSDNSLNFGSLRSAKAQDIFIANGKEFSYVPNFTYHGFRYACVCGKCKISKIYALEIHSSCNRISCFKSDSELLNNISDIMVQTFANNLMSIPTDCHQRDERQGWIADAHLALDSELCAFDVTQFYIKFLQDIADTVCDDGNIIAFTAPMLYGGESLMWTGGYYMILDKLYKATNNKELVAEHYNNLVKYFNFLEKGEKDGLLTIGGLGDWLSLKPTKEQHIRDAVYKDFADKMSIFSSILGFKDAVKYYSNKASEIKNAYNAKYYSPHESNEMSGKSSGYYGTCDEIGQLANALPICFDIAPAAELEKIAEKLIYDIKYARGNSQLTTGLIGTKYVFEALAKIGRNDVALDLLLRKDYPSWNFMLDCGATTVWERWEYMTDNEMNSHCHTPLATPYYWIIRHLLGINNPQKNENGEVVFCVSPYYDTRLNSYSGYLDTEFGRVEVSIQKADKEFVTSVKIPIGCKYILK